MLTHVLERFRDGGVLFDGGLGTMLIARGLQLGRPPEEWNREHPEIVRDVHTSYLQAGADVITTNTFGATPSRLEGYGLGERMAEINKAGVTLAEEARSPFDRGPGAHPARDSKTPDRSPDPRERFIAFGMGPTGKMLPPVGNAEPERLRNEFTRQLRSAGSGYDLVIIETMYDLREALIALDAAKQLTTAPVAVTLTYNKNPRGFFTIMGDEASRAARALEEAGADVVGANCSITSAEMTELGGILRESTEIPILCQPNAGKPRVKDGVPIYEQPPEDFARDAVTLFALGVNAVGGCCGTTPEFIEAARTAKLKH